MGRVLEVALLSLFVMSLLNPDSTWAKRGSSFGKKSTPSNRGTQSKPPSSQPGNYPRQPQAPNRNPNPYPAGGSYPYPGKQNPPSNPGAGGNPNPAGGYPAGGYPNQPGRGNYPAGGNPAAGGYPAGGYPNQPGRGNYPAGGYPAGGGYPNQNPGRGGYPNQYPAAGGYPVAGGYPNQYPARGGGYQYPGAGGYPGGYGGGAVGGYPNWNPNNKILSPRFGGGAYGYGGQGMGGSPFSRSVQGMGIQPKSTNFAKKAMVAAGVGAIAGMAVGYGLGRFPRPHFSFRNPEEEYYYNNYMYKKYGTKSTDEKDYGRDYVIKPPPRAQSYEAFMDGCMNRTDLLKDSSKSGANDEDNDTVSIEEIGYPALIDQVKTRRCVEEYMKYSAKFMEKRKPEQQSQPNHCSPMSYGVMQLFSSSLMLLSSILLLQ
ncbi:prion protein b [Cyprinodon tularosa]|uniref:prion protein b n=1 Tax=Cyprinodon tularosa TaxID=77115 RepID=UPI0018E20612|nr:prion protein b [Cyprinodon tularosa]